MTKTQTVKLLLTAFICFHLLGVIFIPNMSSHIGQKISPIYLKYMHALGLNSPWSFFAPEPFSPGMFIDYIIQTKNGNTINNRFPIEKNPYFFRSRHNRRMAMAKFVLNAESRVTGLFMNYLCNKYPAAKSIRMWEVIAIQPDIKLVQSGQNKISDTVDYKTKFLADKDCEIQVDDQTNI